MSTFNGLVAEFPDIRVDFFRHHADRRRPLACFLSHVHSDHLAGLESLKSPFVYCSAATREILLRLEKYPCRINYAKGILEYRLQTYKHLRNLLKPIPLETPTVLELSPGVTIQVTLFDANHCPGAVMFLFEDDSKAVLYTGDIRSEPWFVNAISRNPCLVEYTSGLKTLDKIYLDTSFIENVEFQPKSAGIAELLKKVGEYPDDTIFHLRAWTYGYEDVWISLSKALKSKVHVDAYKLGIYNSLVARPSPDRFSSQLHLAKEAPALTGFVCGNTPHPGCLTSDEKARIHSCEKGNYCETIKKGPVVWIEPIVAHLPAGTDLQEVGVGGGGDDLERDVELDFLPTDEIPSLIRLLAETDDVPEALKSNIETFLLDAATNGRRIGLNIDISTFREKSEMDVANAITSLVDKFQLGRGEVRRVDNGGHDNRLRTIYFPYSRHSSYPELCHLVQVFNPRDIWPCTVSPLGWLKENVSIRSLFGRYCSADSFEHDDKLDALAARMESRRLQSQTGNDDSQRTTTSLDGAALAILSSPPRPVDAAPGPSSIVTDSAPEVESVVSDTADDQTPQLISSPAQTIEEAGRKRTFEEYSENEAASLQPSQLHTSMGSISSSISYHQSAAFVDAYNAMIRNSEGRDWTVIGLVSTDHHHTEASPEL